MPDGMTHEWRPHQREGWTVCVRCGMVRNYDRETPCRGAPKIRTREEPAQSDAAIVLLLRAALAEYLELADAEWERIGGEPLERHVRAIRLTGVLGPGRVALEVELESRVRG